MIITGKILEFNSKDTIYTKECIQDMLNQIHNFKKPILGTMDYPEDAGVIPLELVSHEIKEIYINNNDDCLEGTFETLNTPKGKILADILDAVGGQETFNQNFFLVPIGEIQVNTKGEIEKFIKINSFNVVARPRKPKNKLL